MTSRDFVFWLQGYLEIVQADDKGPIVLTQPKVECIQKHLAMVFAHDIDPQVPPKVASVLDHLHHGHPGGPKPRC